MSTVAFPASTWGLSWSGRWHIIDHDHGATPGGDRDGGGLKALCGAWLYEQDWIRGRKTSAYQALQAIVDYPSRAPICKKCEKAVNRGR